MGNTRVLRFQHSSSPVKCANTPLEAEPRQPCDQNSWLSNYSHIFLVHAQNAPSFLLPAFPGLTPLQNMAYMDADIGMVVACSVSAEFGAVAGAKNSQKESENVKIELLDCTPIFFVVNGIGDAKGVLTTPLSPLEFPKHLSFFPVWVRGTGC